MKSPHSEAICITCTKSIGQPPALNLLPDGSTCRACADRVLEAQPGIFHSAWAEVEPKAPTPEFSLVEDEQPSKPSA